MTRPTWPITIALDDIAPELIDRLAAASSARSRWEAIERDLRRQLLEIAGDAQELTLDGSAVATVIRPSVSWRVDPEILRQRYPEAYQASAVRQTRSPYLRLVG